MKKFNEYEFLEYCEEKYLNGLCQEDAHRQQWEGTVSDTVRNFPAWRLVCWLGEYMGKESQNDECPF